MRVKWLESVRNDLRHHARYIAQDNPTAAKTVVSDIRSSVANLARYPGLGRGGRVLGTRELVVARLPYTVVYRVRDRIVEVLAVMHQAREWPESFE